MLEVTESILIENVASTLEKLHQIRALGVGIALDNFGTGYSSLSYLKCFPFDKIKIDRSFVERVTYDQQAGAIVRAVVTLATELGMRTTAEGVETVEQKNYLVAEGCSDLQGFLFSSARPASEVPLLIEAISAEQEEAAAA